MNYIWCAMIIISLICAAINGNMAETVNAAFTGAKSSLEVILSFAGVMCMWTGFLKIAEKCELTDKLSHLLSPIVKKLFPDASKEAARYISANISANFLGMGNAATPMGINAMRELDRTNKSDSPTKNMCMLVVINTTSLQLIPSTVIALRAGAGAAAASDIIVPVWIASAAGFAAAVLAVKLFIKDD